MPHITLSRDQAEAHLRKGWPVLHQGRSIGRTADLPAGGEFVAARHDDGSLTRAAMESVIAGGGAVLHQGTVIERVADLPDEATLSAGNEEHTRQLAATIDAQVAALLAQKSQLQGSAPKPQAPPSQQHDEPPAKPQASPEAVATEHRGPVPPDQAPARTQAQPAHEPPVQPPHRRK